MGGGRGGGRYMNKQSRFDYTLEKVSPLIFVTFVVRDTDVG